MPKRNGHNPIRANTSDKQSLGNFGNSSSNYNKGTGHLKCSKCYEEVPPKPGFRVSSLKCPKCGSAVNK